MDELQKNYLEENIMKIVDRPSQKIRTNSEQVIKRLKDRGIYS